MSNNSKLLYFLDTFNRPGSVVVNSKSTFTHSDAKTGQTLTSAINKAKNDAEEAAKTKGNSGAFQDMDIDPSSTSFKGKYPYSHHASYMNKKVGLCRPMFCYTFMQCNS